MDFLIRIKMWLVDGCIRGNQGNAFLLLFDALNSGLVSILGRLRAAFVISSLS